MFGKFRFKLFKYSRKSSISSLTHPSDSSESIRDIIQVDDPDKIPEKIQEELNELAQAREDLFELARSVVELSGQEFEANEAQCQLLGKVVEKVCLAEPHRIENATLNVIQQLTATLKGCQSHLGFYQKGNEAWLDFNERLSTNARKLSFSEDHIIDIFDQSSLLDAAHFDLCDLDTRKEAIVGAYQERQYAGDLPCTPEISDEYDSYLKEFMRRLFQTQVTINNTRQEIKSLVRSIEEYEVLDELGVGGFGQVVKARRLAETFALKKILLGRNNKMDDEAKRTFLTEAKIMHSVRHNRLVSLYSIIMEDDPPNYGLVMEYMPNGSLAEYILMNGKLDRTNAYNIALDIASGMEYLHSRNFNHRDLKSANVLLDKDLHAKVCDFGLAQTRAVAQKNSGKSDHTSSRLEGTINYMAPELFREIDEWRTPNAATSNLADVYAFGIICWEMVSGQWPWKESKQSAIPTFVMEGKRPPMPKDVNAQFKDLIESCWHQDPEKRMTFEEVINYLAAHKDDVVEFEPPPPPEPE
ncbi:hypothetical protein HK102_009275, partial [Quaeritorhiza haematococci]